MKKIIVDYDEVYPVFDIFPATSKREKFIEVSDKKCKALKEMRKVSMKYQSELKKLWNKDIPVNDRFL